MTKESCVSHSHAPPHRIHCSFDVHTSRKRLVYREFVLKRVVYRELCIEILY